MKCPFCGSDDTQVVDTRANLEANTDDFGEYQQTAIESWQNDEIVSSLAHGAAASVSWLTDITAAVAKFGSDEDVAGLQEGLVSAAEKNAQS